MPTGSSDYSMVAAGAEVRVTAYETVAAEEPELVEVM
jgi:hypothetical protein